jgi:hypothetical protein
MLNKTLGAHVPATAVLEMYRGRWQVELAFKRLKSLLALGHLKKVDPQGARSWLQGKLLVAILMETLICPSREREVAPRCPTFRHEPKVKT